MELHKYRTKTIPGQPVEKVERSCCPRHFLLHAVITALCALAFSGQVYAQQGESASDKAEPAATRIAVDEDAGVIRFFIEGKEKARLDAAGFHVRENIDYGGNLTDYGHSGFDGQADMKEYERLKTEDRDAP